MNIEEIVKGALKYPLLDWKRILILGIIIVFTSTADIAMSLGTTNIDVISLLMGIGFIIGFLVNGYMFRIIKSSLDGDVKLPGFKDLIGIGADGVKVFIAFIVYLVFPVLIILFFVLLLFGFDSSLVSGFMSNFGFNLLGFDTDFIPSIVWPGIANLSLISQLFGPGGIFAPIYIILIIPVFLVAIANMAYYEGELRSAFRFKEIIDEITSIGWLNLLKWYVATGLLFLSLHVLIIVINYIFYLIRIDRVGGILLSLTLIPYAYMYIARSVALFYMPDKED